MKKLFVILFIIIILLCSCDMQTASVKELSKICSETKIPTYRGSYYYKNNNNTIEYFDDITHDLRQLLYTYSCVESTIYTNEINNIRFVIVGNYDKLIDIVEYMIDSGAYEVYAEFDMDTAGNSIDKAKNLIDYYFNTCGISHNKTMVLKIRENQKAFYFDELNADSFIGYFEDDTYEILNIANIKNTIVFDKYFKVEV